jgi:hypothetical protein
MIQSMKGRARDVAHIGDRRGACSVLVGRPGRSRRIWENHIIMVDQESGLGGLDWIEQAQYGERCGTLVFALMNFRVPKIPGNFLTI